MKQWDDSWEYLARALEESPALWPWDPRDVRPLLRRAQEAGHNRAEVERALIVGMPTFSQVKDPALASWIFRALLEFPGVTRGELEALYERTTAGRVWAAKREARGLGWAIVDSVPLPRWFRRMIADPAARRGEQE